MLTSLARGLLALSNSTLELAAWSLSRHVNESPRRILVHRVGRLGDGAAAWPAVAHLRERYPNAHIVLWTSVGETPSPGLAEFAAGMVDEVRTYKPSELRSVANLRAQAASFRSERFDLWQALPQVRTTPWTELRNLLFARGSGARQLRGFQVGNLRWLGLWLERRLRCGPSESARLLQLVGANEDSQRYEVAAAAEARAKVLVPDRRVLALAPGSARPATLWPLSRFEAIARDALLRGDTVVVLGGDTDQAAGAELNRALPQAAGAGRLHNLAGRTTPEETIAVLQRARALVTNDSGVAHLGGLAGVPMIVVQSARDVAGRWDPRGPDVRVLRENPACSPCWAETCPLDHRCLLDLGVERVLAALDAIDPTKRA